MMDQSHLFVKALEGEAMEGNSLYQPTKHFSRKLQKVKQFDPSGHKRIQQVIERLLAEPNDADVLLCTHGDGTET